MLNSIRLNQYCHKQCNALAFEYATGQLRGLKKTFFSLLLEHSAHAQQHVSFWQEQLIALNASTPELAPQTRTWQAIAHSTQQARTLRPGQVSPKYWLAPAATGALAASIIMALILLPLTPAPAPKADYFAVLSDAQGGALVTATSFGESKPGQGNHLLIDWQTLADTSPPQPAEGNLQLWAKSKRDQQVRSIAVLDRTQMQEDSTLVLSPAQWRLVTDAHSLIITLEEAGGSAIGEPSERILARGPCIRLKEALL